MSILVATDAADAAGPSTTDGCTAPFTNAAAISGKWAYIDRGTCGFQAKVDNAKAAGAVGIVVGDNAPDRVPGSMAGTSTIYGVMVTQADGTRIKGAATTVTATVQAEDISARTAVDPLADGREVRGLRWRDPRHVDADLLRQPRQGDGRRVQLRPV